MSNKLSRRDALFGGSGLVAGAGAVALLSGGARLAHGDDHKMTKADIKLGTVHSFSTGGLTFHSYISPAQAVHVTSQIVEFDDALMVVDSTFIPDTGAEVASLIASLGKPVAKAVLSHEHPDHWSAADAVGLTFDTLPAVRADVAAEAGDALPMGIKNGADLALGMTDIAGTPVEFRVVEGCEAAHNIVAVLPEQKVAIVQDLVYNSVYFAPGYDRQKWIDELKAFRDDPAFETLLVGHGLPASRGELDKAIQYLTFMDAQMSAAGATPESVSAAIKAEYPGFGGEFLLGLIGEYWPS